MMMRAFIILAIVSLSLQQALAQQKAIDSLENHLSTLPNDTMKVNEMYNISKTLRRTGSNLEKALYYAEKSLELAKELNYTYGIGNGYIALGSYYYVQSLNDKAFQNYQEALTYLKKADKKEGLALVYSNLGMVSEDIGNYTKSLEFYLLSNQFAQEVNDKQLITNNLLNISILMLNQKKHQEAENYALQALNSSAGKETLVEKALTLNTLGVIYFELKSFENSLSHINRALEIFTDLNHIRGETACYNNLGMVNFALDHLQEARSSYQKAFEKSRENNFLSSLVIAQNGLASILLKEQEENLAIVMYEASQKVAEENQLAKDRIDTYEGLSKAYAQQGNFFKAFEIQNKLLGLKDSLFNDENTRKLNQLQANYELEKKQAEIELLQKDQQQANLLRNAMLAGFAALLIIAALIVSRQRLKIKQNRLLLEKGQEVAKQNELLASQAQVLENQAKELSLQTQKLREMDEAKSRFFANISHEFRTPLTIILNNLSDQMEQAQAANASKDLAQLEVMQRNARRLLQLINQLLDLSKLESGKMKLELENGNLKQFITLTVASFSSLADYRQIHLNLHLPNEALLCRFDPDKLEKILYNLLSNAFKFTPNGGEINVRTESFLAEKLHYLQISVQDSGPGIASAEIQHIFDRFYQGKQHYADEQGSGIGLALTKELVELHQGHIWAESEAGKGTCFSVKIPFLPRASEAGHYDIKPEIDPMQELWMTEKPAKDKQTQQDKNSPIILVVEDNHDLRSYIKKHLEEKYEVTEAVNGSEGLKKALQLIPDLIITDRMMPEMDGLQLCHRLKEDERTSHIPLIMLTALATNEGKLKGLKTGADEYLTKPFDKRELDLRVHNLIESRRKLRERYSKILHLEPASIEVASTDDVFLQKVLKVIEEHMGDADFSSEDFGRQIGLSRMQLHRKLKALTGQTPGDLLRTMRLKRAAQLLDKNAGNISEIAYQVGFNNLSYFAKCFREEFGMNPNEYQSRQAAAPLE